MIQRNITPVYTIQQLISKNYNVVYKIILQATQYKVNNTHVL